MKKFLAIALALTGVFAINAQDAKTLYKEAETLDKAFTKAKPTLEFPTRKISPEDAEGLIKAFEIYAQVIPLDSLPNEKGEIKPKYVKKIRKSYENHAKAQDFSIAAEVLNEAKKLYPEAYKAYLEGGRAGRQYNVVPDTVYSIDFLNAGICAYQAGEFGKAMEAFQDAIDANCPDVRAFTLKLASINNLASRDTAFRAEAPQLIHQCAEQGVNRFGADNDYLYSNYISYYFDNSKYDEARKILDKAIAEAPKDNLYRLRGMLGNAEGNFEASIPDFVALGNMSENYEYLREAADQLNRIGKHMLGQLDGIGDADKIAKLRANVFEPAMKIAKKAKANENADGRIDNIIGDLEYTLQNNL